MIYARIRLYLKRMDFYYQIIFQTARRTVPKTLARVIQKPESNLNALRVGGSVCENGK